MLQPVPGRIGKEFLEVALQDSLCIPSAQEAGCPQVEAGNAIGFIRQDDAFLEISMMRRMILRCCSRLRILSAMVWLCKKTLSTKGCNS